MIGIAVWLWMYDGSPGGVPTVEILDQSDQPILDQSGDPILEQ